MAHGNVVLFLCTRHFLLSLYFCLCVFAGAEEIETTVELIKEKAATYVTIAGVKGERVLVTFSYVRDSKGV